VQAVAWVLSWPLVAGLLLASDRRGSPLRYGLAVAVLLVGGVLWVSALVGDDPGTDDARATAAAVEAERGEQAARERAAEEAEEAAAAERAARAAARAEVRAAERAARAEAREAERAEAERDEAERAEAERDEAERDEAERVEAERAEAEAAARAEAEARAVEEAARAAEEAERAAATWTVFNVVDGDTVDVRAGNGTQERVRIIGIDTPERGECGFTEASAAMASLVQGEQVDLVAGARDDRDRYDRILRYVDVGGRDAGLALIDQGLAIARYDSRDGYGRHDRETAYVAADRATQHLCAAAPAPAEPQPASPPSSGGAGPGSGPGGAWKNCTEARDHGAAPVHRGDPGYGPHLDRDGDGVGCER
jgi:endonuclease YncB( thermonuclease family)